MPQVPPGRSGTFRHRPARPSEPPPRTMAIPSLQSVMASNRSNTMTLPDLRTAMISGGSLSPRRTSPLPPTPNYATNATIRRQPTPPQPIQNQSIQNPQQLYQNVYQQNHQHQSYFAQQTSYQQLQQQKQDEADGYVAIPQHTIRIQQSDLNNQTSGADDGLEIEVFDESLMVELH